MYCGSSIELDGDSKTSGYRYDRNNMFWSDFHMERYRLHAQTIWNKIPWIYRMYCVSSIELDGDSKTSGYRYDRNNMFWSDFHMEWYQLHDQSIWNKIPRG